MATFTDNKEINNSNYYIDKNNITSLEFELISPIEETVVITNEEYIKGKATEKINYILEAYNCEKQLLDTAQTYSKNKILLKSIVALGTFTLGAYFLDNDFNNLLTIGAFAISGLNIFNAFDEFITLKFCKDRKQEVDDITKEVKKLQACERLFK